MGKRNDQLCKQSCRVAGCCNLCNKNQSSAQRENFLFDDDGNVYLVESVAHVHQSASALQTSDCLKVLQSCEESLQALRSKSAQHT